VVQRESSNRDLGQKLKVLAHVHIIFCIFALCKISLQVKGEHGSNGPLVNTLMPLWPIHSSRLSLHHCVLSSQKQGVRKSFAGKFKNSRLLKLDKLTIYSR